MSAKNYDAEVACKCLCYVMCVPFFLPIIAREQLYVAAVRALFKANTSLQDRETQYSQQMKALWDLSPGDADACALYALSLLGQLRSVGGYVTDTEAATTAQLIQLLLQAPRQQVHSRSTITRAPPILYTAKDKLEDCVDQFPNHVGAWHYLTHVYDEDEPDMASQGVPAALKLAALAPKSNVAQHMASHFFLRSGNWTQVVLYNQAAVSASDSYCKAVSKGNDCDADNRWHALEWQLFGQLQQCGVTAAYTSYLRIQGVAASMNYTGDYVQWLYRSYAHMQLQSLNSMGIIPLRNSTDNDTAMLPPPLYDTGAVQNAADIMDHFWPPHAEAHALLARVFSLTYGSDSARLQNPTVVTTVNLLLARLDTIASAQSNLVNSSASSLNRDMLTQLTIVQLQAKALVGASACAAGLPACNVTSWMALMDDALARHTSISNSTTLPSLKIAPTPEFYGNLLVATNGNATTARDLFLRCLNELPGRMQCLLGLARTSNKLNDLPGAIGRYKQLQSQCSTGDKAFPALKEALSRLSPLSPPPSSKKGLLRRALQVEAQVVVA
ncbi:hypothetical protein VOLCADRAFT_89315 [Volvox carteri f. nagariensis]|uniref:Uncharacterized protein n=1 Tax=Volvox carteri f. nagariensis TaxID=3068 RepID=D8TRD8_VOLCA|nr:uncharacterized protein VOLCADRAFT_89315 [Volvox carteri f. nagariensis]EFJ49877.1 hypothetical protein VOLCADRAFT_89315 [Volvox carteri f. nagariensis]|eukprot:XP_002948942.1 hypothetical protein VOLCADRAFT_89315 [Volvox carteri f. nagariensis]